MGPGTRTGPREGEPSYADLVERLVSVTSELFQAKSTLREYGRLEDDPSLQHLVAAWRIKAMSEGIRADLMGTRCALAERLVRQLLAGQKPDPRDVQAWREATKETAA